MAVKVVAIQRSGGAFALLCCDLCREKHELKIMNGRADLRPLRRWRVREIAAGSAYVQQDVCPACAEGAR